MKFAPAQSFRPNKFKMVPNKFKKATLIVTWLTLSMVYVSCSQDREPLVVAYWNVENLFDTVDDPETNDEEFSLGGRKNVTQEIYDLKIKHTAEVLADLDADIIGLSEVEHSWVLEDVNQAYLDRDYEIIEYESPDERGIDNALMYDPKRFKVIASRPITNTLPSGDKTRDILYVKGEYAGETLHLFVNHWPSNYGGRKKAIPKRAATAQLVVKQVSAILQSNAAAEIILLGDFNEEPNEMNVQSLKAVGLSSLMEPMLGHPKIGTYVYRGEDLFPDQIIIHESMRDEEGLAIVPASASILDLPKYRQQEGKYAHYPFRFWAGNNLLGGYSDHLAVWVEIRKK